MGAEEQIERLREEVNKARKEKREANELAHAYALIIEELAENLASVTAERDALASSPQLPRLTPKPAGLPVR